MFALDHAVIALRSLEQAVVDYRQAGFTVTPGGRHPGRNSANALVVFQDGSYLELIAWDKPSPEERWWRVLDAHGEGLVDFALLPQDIAAAVAGARARGFDELALQPGGRMRPDGVRIEWQSARQQRHDLPFLCADVTPRALRVPEGEARRHANGALGIASVQVAVADLAQSRQRYAALLGPQALRQGDAIAVADCSIVLQSEPARPRGEGPSRLALHFAAAPTAAAVDPLLAHGVRFD